MTCELVSQSSLLFELKTFEYNHSHPKHREMTALRLNNDCHIFNSMPNQAGNEVLARYTHFARS